MRRFRISVVGLTVLLGLSISFAADDSYRLAGSILTDDHGITLALIETPDGIQQLLREGDSIDGGTVVEITQNTVRLRFTNEDIVLKLEGTGIPQQVSLEQYRMEDYLDSLPQRVATDALNTISELVASAGEEDSAKLASEVLGYLDLPADAHIMAVNDKGVGSPAEALQEIVANIDARTDEDHGLSFVISIATTEGKKRVYVIADESGQIGDQTIGAN